MHQQGSVRSADFRDLVYQTDSILKNISSIWSRKTSDGDSFEAIVAPHMDRLYRLAYRFSGRRENAEDLVQELLVRMYPRLKELRGLEKPGSWLAKSLYHLFIDETRRENRAPISLLENAAIDVENVASVNAGPEHDLHKERWLEQVERAVYRLNPDQRSLVALHDMEGYSLPELADMLDTPVGTLKSRLHRARSRLRELIGDQELGDSEK